MSEKCIVQKDWEKYLNELSKKIKNMDEAVEIDIIAPGVFEGEEAEGLQLVGISYDHKDNIVSVFCEVLDHIISKPQEIAVEDENGAITSIRITDGSGVEHLIKFSKPIS